MRKKRLDSMPPVENIRRREIVFKIKKLIGPPRFKFLLFLIETIRKINIKSPISGTVNLSKSLFCQTKTKRNELRIKRE